MSDKFRLKNTIKYPTSLIVNGATSLGLEIAESLLEQGGYVVLIDGYTPQNITNIINKLGENSLVSLLDYSAIPHLEEDLRRLDYVFYLQHETHDLVEAIPTQDFLKYSNYLDTVLDLTTKFEAKFILTTSMAAQQRMATMELDAGYALASGVKQGTYNEMEIQKYSESLVLEYITKANLNGRIVRVGEIVGKGIDLSKQTTFTQLLLSAVTGGKLKLPGDGLEAEWYVHLLDAAYGVVKAQFTKNSVGNVYSLCYENSITHLSMAYKLQELEPDSKEIDFDRSSFVPGPRPHKPAPSLSQIGWRPNVALEQALAESLAVAKTFVLSDEYHGQHGDGHEQNIVDKIRSMLGSTDSAIGQEPESGPVSRLIAERKKQELARSEAMDRANSYIKGKKSRRSLPFTEKLRNAIWSWFTNLQNSFAFLRNISPAQFVVYSLLLAVVLVLYFTLVSPLLIATRNLLIANEQMTVLVSAVAANDLILVENSSSRIANSLDETANVWKELSGAANLVGISDQHRNISQVFDEYATAARGLQQVTYSLSPLGEYLNGYVNNVRYRANAESYLTLGNSSDYAAIINEISRRAPFIEQGRETLRIANSGISSTNSNSLPGFLKPALSNVGSNLLEQAARAEGLSEFALHAADLLGGSGQRSYLVLLMDNSRPMPAGGAIAAYMVITVRNGAPISVQLQSIENFGEDHELPGYAVDAIKLYSYITPEKLKVADLASIGDSEIFFDATKYVWGNHTGNNIDMVVKLDFEALEDWVAVLGGIELERENFDGTNLLRNLSTLQTSTPTLARRHDIAAQLFAQAVDRTLEDPAKLVPKVFEALSVSASQNHITFSNTDLSFRRAVKQYDLGGSFTKSPDFYANIYLHSDPKLISPVRYPSVNQSITVNVRADSSLFFQNLYIKFASVESIDAVSICLPLSSKDLQLAEGDGGTRSIVNSSGSSRCLVADIVDEQDLSVTFKSFPIENSVTEEYNIELGVGKVPGAEVSSDIEISLDPELKLTKITPVVISLGDLIGFREALQKHQYIELFIEN